MFKKISLVVSLLVAVTACQTTSDRPDGVDLTLLEVTAGLCRAKNDGNNKTYKGKVPEGHVFSARNIGDGWIKSTIGYYNSVWMIAYINPHKNKLLCNYEMWPEYKDHASLPKANRGQLTLGLAPLKQFAPIK